MQMESCTLLVFQTFMSRKISTGWQTQTLFNDPTVVSIAEAHDKTSAQIILRWHLQAGNIAIPGSSNPDHILENLSIFDFSLSDEEMKQLTDLDKNERLGDW